MDFTRTKQGEFCESCCRVNMSLSPFQNEGHKAENMYQYIYADIEGPFPTQTPEGNGYSITPNDKFSNET